MFSVAHYQGRQDLPIMHYTLISPCTFQEHLLMVLVDISTWGKIEKGEVGSMDSSRHPCCWPRGHLWAFPFSPIYLKHSSPLAMTSSRLSGLPNFVTQRYISEESETLIITLPSGESQSMCFFTVSVGSGNTRNIKWIIRIPYVFLPTSFV